jgi:enamine deaminase RidA (YjgF/YER057c/UK114 family)
MHSRPWIIAALLVATATPAAAHDIVRRANSGFPIASSVMVPAAAELVYLSGVLADAADTSAPAGSIERLGDTETQARSVFAKIDAQLRAAGYAMGDVVRMNVFLVGDPRKGGGIDFEGLMHGYLQHFGTASQKNVPARTTVQVAGLPIPGALVEIEVIAARAAPH